MSACSAVITCVAILVFVAFIALARYDHAHPIHKDDLLT